MEPLFQNRYLVTQENISEFYRKTAPLWRRVILYPLLILLMGYGMFLATEELHELVFGLILAVYFSILVYMQSKQTDKTIYARYVLNKLDNLERVIEFTDCISVYSPSTGSRNAYDYAHVYKLYQSENLYILMLPYKMGIFLEKGRFTVGNESEFIIFIENQCVHLKK